MCPILSASAPSAHPVTQASLQDLALPPSQVAAVYAPVLQILHWIVVSYMCISFMSGTPAPNIF